MSNKGKMLNDMLVLVTNKFNGIFDKGGQPYVLHLLKVLYYTKTEDEELQCIALGHDLVEDTDVTFKDLSEMGFTSRIIMGIAALTKMPGQTPEEYMEEIKANGADAIRVKFADLRHNSDIRRLKGITEKDVKRIAKYHAMYLELKEELI
jgi:GTP diphosphokinase / guanosine-3',5'-bis(diphosphate) 3'-diphosphatase